MTQEEKSLLLKDLCARLPYDVVVRCYFVDGGGEEVLDTDDIADLLYNEENSEFPMYKPYLRPMSSMTQEEATEYANCGNIIAISHQNDYLIPNPKSIHWLLENHFDFMGLIPKDLAIEVTKENNPY